MGDESALVPKNVSDALTGDPQVELTAYFSKPGYEKYGRFIFAALGAIPWVGGIIAASAAVHAEKEQGRVNLLMYRWLEEHQSTFKRLEETVAANRVAQPS